MRCGRCVLLLGQADVIEGERRSLKSSPFGSFFISPLALVYRAASEQAAKRDLIGGLDLPQQLFPVEKTEKSMFVEVAGVASGEQDTV